MLRAILNKSWRQHPTKQQLYGHLPPITKTIQIRRTRHAEHCWTSKNELISDLLQRTPSHWRAKVERVARTYIQKLCADTGYNLEDLSGAMDDRDGWRKRVKKIRASSVTWWWWYIYIYIYIMVWVFANGTGDQISILGWVILKSQKMVLYASLLNTEHSKVWIKGK